MFQIDTGEAETLRSQIETSKRASGGGRRYAPYVFTERGVAMLSSVLRSKRAISVNIEIMRAFVEFRRAPVPPGESRTGRDRLLGRETAV